MAFDIAAAREYLARRDRERARRRKNLEARARNDADTIIAMLAEKYRPLRIVQWGSLLRPGRFREWSDIDIAMEGLKDPLDGLRALDAILAMTEKMQLEKYGYSVRTVTTGEKAVEAVEISSDIDLILMDINLGSGIDGTQAAELILQDHDIPCLPFIPYGTRSSREDGEDYLLWVCREEFEPNRS